MTETPQHFSAQIKSFRMRFWLLNSFQMLEKLAYWIVLLQMPIYIAQKDIEGGLHWEQTVKGLIFFWWALVQNTVPIFAGGFADKWGHKKTIFAAYFLIIIGYMMLAFSKEFPLFLMGTLILGLGSGIFKPALQGSLATELKRNNSSVGWGVYFMLLNLAVFFGPPLSKYLKGISWEAVFIGSAVIIALNALLLIFLKGKKTESAPVVNNNPVLKDIFRHFFQWRISLLIIIMSGFAMIYMQFYETLPNFIYDWSDTSSIAKMLALPDFMTMETGRGVMISYEWLYNINAGLIVVGVVFISWVFARMSNLKVILIGISIATLGLLISGSAMAGGFTVAGMMIYTIGEMITNPKFADHLSGIAPEGKKAMYMSFLNISLAIGLGGGSLLGGFLYKSLGEKATLAQRYLATYYNTYGVELSEAFSTLEKMSGLSSSSEASELLWQTYSPWVVWVPFAVIGMLSVSALHFYIKHYKK